MRRGASPEPLSRGVRMPKMVNLIIDGQQVTVPQGTLVVDAAKKIGNDIPVFCYHPKMEPVGMCRMCLVDIGRPQIDRATGQPVLEADGTPKLQFGPKLETACTTPVSEGMVVRTDTQPVTAARKEVVEFILTSHPLDCPICDKGGECPLQNLTMGFGPGESRFYLEDKKHLAKHVPLGDLIYLDRERCIQCARCVRFQDVIADDAVIGFYNRGRSLEITTFSEPGFDSIFSGNTTDICPVGALTTADFRFGARPWELKSVASICTHCPVGCNITLNVRREAKADGKWVVKRVMPRQNEAVNEIWICDKGRFGYHYTESSQRLSQPLVRKGEELVPASWDEALAKVAAQLHGAGLVTLAGGRLANEDLFNVQQLTAAQNGQAVLYSDMGGGDLVSQFGLTPGSNLGDLGKGSAILVIGSDLHEEAPLWWLRVKEAAKRGATLIVANPRATRLDKFAAHVLRYAYGEESAAMASFLPNATVNTGWQAAVQAFSEADNTVVFYGSEGMGLRESTALAQTAASVLAQTNRAGKVNNGLVAVWPQANTQGAWELGFRPAENLAAVLSQANVLLIAAADPAGDDPRLAQAVDAAQFVVVQELFLTETAKRADVVLPVLPVTEREGTFTSGERRVQRFYPALMPVSSAKADYEIAAELGKLVGAEIEGRAASLVMKKMAAQVTAFAGMSYQRLSEVTEQWPLIGRADVYYGGTGYDNRQGLGLQMSLAQGSLPGAAKLPALSAGLRIVPVTRLYDLGQTLTPTTLLHQRMAKKEVWLHPAEAARLAVAAGELVELAGAGWKETAAVRLDENLPEGVLVAPRSVGLPVREPQTVQILKLAAEPVVK